jgi:hypothetical protein
MDARLYLELAKKLVDEVKAGRSLVAQGAGAPECRTAISRAYYAAYNGAVSFLDVVGLSSGPSHEGHRHLRDVLDNSGSDDLKRVSKLLDNLQTERKLADYNLNVRRPEILRQAEAVLRNAEDVFKLLDQVRSNTAALGPIATAVNAYVTRRRMTAFRPKSLPGTR